MRKGMERRMRPGVRLAVMSASVVLMAMGACPEANDQTMGKPYDVTMVNDAGSTLPIHIVGPGEFLDPENRLAPGGMRFNVVRVNNEGEVLFRAGRDGVILAAVECGNIDARSDDKSATVTWTEGDGRIDCQGGLRTVRRPTVGL